MRTWPTRPGFSLRGGAAAALIAGALLAPSVASAQAKPPPPPPQPAPAGAQPAPPPGAQPAPAGAQPAPPPGYGTPPPGYGTPPPGYGTPPPGYGAPPGYGTPPPGYGTPGYYPYPPPGYYPYPPPGYTKPPELPKKLEYHEGMEIPPGYTLETRVRRGLVIAGGVTFGATYMISLFVASVADSVGDDEEFTPLYIPIVGPFITIGTADSEGAGTAYLILDGVAQAGGVAMFIAGLVAQEQVLIRNDASGRKLQVMPMPMGRGGAGLGVWGTM